MIKILHLNNYLPYTSGVTRYIYYIVKNTKDNFEHEVMCFGGNAIEEFRNLNIKVNVIQKNSILSLPNIYFHLFNYVKKNNFDIVHNHHRVFDTLIFFTPNRNFKTVTTVHSKVFDWKILSYKADRLISVSDVITEHLIEHYSKSNDKIFTFKNFVELSDIKVYKSNSDLKKLLGLSDNQVIVFIGRFDREKGTDILIKAFEKFYRVNNKVSLVMIGEGIEEIELKHVCHEKKLPVNFVKPLADIYDYYNLADVVVLPSRVDPFPYVMLEAGLMKKPFIGSNVDGIPELIKHKVNGVLFKSESVSELVESFKMILEEKDFALEIAKNLHKDVIENYTAEKVIPYYVALYNSII